MVNGPILVTKIVNVFDAFVSRLQSGWHGTQKWDVAVLSYRSPNVLRKSQEGSGSIGNREIVTAGLRRGVINPRDAQAVHQNCQISERAITANGTKSILALHAAQ